MYPKEYVQFLVHFHGDRDYFECHEILEEYWKQIDSGNKNSVWVGFIQLSVSSYHHRRCNFNGALKTLEKALKIFSLHEDSLSKLGLDHQLFFSFLKELLIAIKNKTAYKSFNLPISDPLLLQKCQELSEKTGMIWGNESNLSNQNIIHRHQLRDRTKVFEERQRALLKRKGNYRE